MGPDLYIVATIGEGFLAVMAKPVAGEWLRDDLRAIRAKGVKRIVSLLEPAEQSELGLESEANDCEAVGLAYGAYPIPDRGLPASLPDFRVFAHDLYVAIFAGQSTVIHCRAGIGRSGLVAASVLLEAGYSDGTAFDLISKARGVSVPDTDDQRQFVNSLAQVR